ncbi:hypothetical protein POTOM_009356 [Populus tomentosa]|uniref:Alkaline/neutral invertase n=1 Tax=Populus tomentosa TaxID=118781 RepID=A0A8X8AAW8_POPTO|nr:hypothetical protein POTOM_009356 [Populus tomentosa]
MSPMAAMDMCENGSVKSFSTGGSMFEIDSEFLRLFDRHRPVNVVYNTPRSCNFESHPMVSDAWESCIEVFVMDFVPSALAFLMNGEHEVLRNFLSKTLHLQSREKMVDQFKLGAGVMPASFKVLHHPDSNIEALIADFGESAIRRVAPVDSGFWWIILLRAFTKSTRDSSLAEMPECRRGTPYAPYPEFMSGVYGSTIEIQALFFMALRCALILLKQDDEGKEFVERIGCLISCLLAVATSLEMLVMRERTFVGSAEICYPALESHEWRIGTGCDPKNTRRSYQMEGLEQIVVSSNDIQECSDILSLCDCFDAVLLWLLTAVCIKTGRPQFARRAVELAESRLSKDIWPENHDGKLGRYLGKQARKFQTWSLLGTRLPK